MTTLHASGWSIVLSGLVSVALAACGEDGQSLESSRCADLPPYKWTYVPPASGATGTWKAQTPDGKDLTGAQLKQLSDAVTAGCATPMGTALSLDSNGNPVKK